MVDEYAGGNSSLKVYFTDIVESYIKSISVRSDTGDSFNTIMDERLSLHYYSLYNVPFDSPANRGQSWTYRISRLSSPAQSNTHLVRVSSGGHQAGLSVDVWSHVLQGRLRSSVILYTRVTLGMKPVVNATVVCTEEAGGYSVQLLDTGSGDPDTVRGDGVYSRYLQYLLPGPHSLACTVYGQNSYVARGLRPAPLSQFTRTVCCAAVTVLEDQAGLGGPPARILDLSVGVVTASQEIHLQWTAPGDDYDWGKLASYQLFSSPRAESYYSSPHNTSQAQLVQSFSAGKHAGQPEQHTVRVNNFDQEIFYVLVPVDTEGNVGEISNLVSAYMPRPQLIGGEAGGSSNTPLREGLFDPMRRPTEPNLVIMYVIVGIVCIVIFTFIVIVTVIIVIRNKTSCDPPGSSSDSLHHQQTSSQNLHHSQSKESISDYKISMTGDTNQESLDIFNHLPSTRETNTYIKGYQTSPTYAKPVPKSLRKSKAEQSSFSGGGESGNIKQSVGFVIREEGDGEEEYSQYKDNYVDYARISTLKKVAPPTLPKPCKPDILSTSNNYSAYPPPPTTTRNITTV